MIFSKLSKLLFSEIQYYNHTLYTMISNYSLCLNHTFCTKTATQKEEAATLHQGLNYTEYTCSIMKSNWYSRTCKQPLDSSSGERTVVRDKDVFSHSKYILLHEAIKHMSNYCYSKSSFF